MNKNVWLILMRAIQVDTLTKAERLLAEDWLMDNLPVGTDTQPQEKELEDPVKKARKKGPFRL